MKNGNVIKLVKCIIGGVIVCLLATFCFLQPTFTLVGATSIAVILHWLFGVIEKPHKEDKNDNKPVS